MGVFDILIGRHYDDYVTIFLIFFLVIVGIAMSGKVNLSQVSSSFKDIAKFVVGAAAASSGVWILYKTERSRIPTDDILGMITGIGLLSFGGYLVLGQYVSNFFSSASSFATSVLPYVLAGAIVLAGAKLASVRHDKSSEIIGMLMMLVGVVVLAISIGWINIPRP